MKRIFITSLFISVSAFALAANAQVVVETEAVQEAAYQEPITVPAETVAVESATEATTETVEQAPAGDVGGPQSIVNIPSEQETVAVEETQEVTLSADDEIRKDGEEKAIKIFNAIDADGNGSITQEEFLSFHSKLIERKILKSNAQLETPLVPVQDSNSDSETPSEAPEAPVSANE